jgi:hypothetical protein
MRRGRRAIGPPLARHDPDGRHEHRDPDDARRDALVPALAIAAADERFHDALGRRELVPGALKLFFRLTHL